MIITNRAIRAILFACTLLIALAFADSVQAQDIKVTFTNNTGQPATDFHLIQTYGQDTIVITKIIAAPVNTGPDGGYKRAWTPFSPTQPMFPLNPNTEFDLEDVESVRANDAVEDGNGLAVVIQHTGSGPFSFKYWWTGGPNYSNEVLPPVKGGSYDPSQPVNKRFDFNTVPEPSEISVLLVGAGALGLLIRRRKLAARKAIRTSASV